MWWLSKRRDPRSLEQRLSLSDKRYPTFRLLLDLLGERNPSTLIETGTARKGLKGLEGDGGGTILFVDWLASQDRGHLYSVDNSKRSIRRARRSVCKPSLVTFICSDSVHFLQNFSEPIDFLYLDSLNFDANYPLLSQSHHLSEIEAALPKLSEKALIMIDDCGLPHGGKGKLAIQLLLEYGWKKVADAYQVILSK